MDNLRTLTVVVLDKDSKPAPGAEVSVEQTGQEGVTDISGEIELQLGRALKYDITVKNGSDEVTVPYYVTKDGATRLVVNPQYVRSVEKKQNNDFSFSDTTTLVPVGILLGVIVFIFIIWKFFKRRR